tara:strand:- start:7799 stop:8770 length:972 start_codon:yes stop_codon:yes gene_type:complete
VNKKDIKNILPPAFDEYQINTVEQDASNRKYYRIKKGKNNYLLVDSSDEPQQYKNFIKVHNILSQYRVSIPKIYYIDDYLKTVVIEDFGKLRYDKIINKENTKKILKFAIDSLIIFKNQISFKKNYFLPIYNYNTFKKEISEFVDDYYYYHSKKNIKLSRRSLFFNTWKQQYNKFSFNFDSFVHKDFNLNNLFYLPKRTSNLKCGIIDFQDSFWGEDCWDLFSILEDSRVFFDDKFNEELIEYYCTKTFQIKKKKDFTEKYDFFNCARQTRLMGRWIKLHKKNKSYLKYLKITKKRLLKSLNKPHMTTLLKMYIKLLPDEFEN